MITKDSLFKPKGTGAETKAAATDKAFRAIVDAEAKLRDAKTERLRRARLDMEARRPAAPEKPKKGRKAKAG